MARKKRLTPKDKKIQQLEADVQKLERNLTYWQEEAESYKTQLSAQKRENNANQAELRDQRGKAEGFLKTMTDSVRQLHDVVRAYGQPLQEQKPRRHPKTGEWIDTPTPVPPSPERFIGYVEGSLQRIAIEGTHMMAPMMVIGVDHGGSDFTAMHRLKI